jgi:hypothetical protein
MRNYISLLFLFLGVGSFGQAKKNAAITFDMRAARIDLGKSYIEINSYQPDSGHYVLYKKIPVSDSVFTIVLPADDPMQCSLDINSNGASRYQSSNFYITDEPIYISFDSTDAIIKSKQNDFAADNEFLLFAVPALIENDKVYSRGFLRRSYELKRIPVFPYALMIWRMQEYERNVIRQVEADKQYFYTLVSLEYNKDRLSLKTLDSCLTILGDNFARSTVAQRLRSYIDQSKRMLPGMIIPPFNVMDSNSNTAFGSERFYAGSEFTLLDVGASWCIPCRANNRELKSIYGSIDTTRFRIISVSMDDDKARWKSALLQDSLPWRNYIAVKGGWSGNVGKTFSLTAIPYNILVDKTGKIVTVSLLPDELRRFFTEKGLLYKK